jgi:hypothetical protein
LQFSAPSSYSALPRSVYSPQRLSLSGLNLSSSFNMTEQAS